jgi:hypothetical protein
MPAQRTQSKPLTFGELAIGKRFIGFPSEDLGRNGVPGAHRIFIKYAEDTSSDARDGHINNVIAISTGSRYYMPKGMKIIEVI